MALNQQIRIDTELHSQLTELLAYVGGLQACCAGVRDGHTMDMDGFQMTMLLEPIEDRVCKCIGLLNLVETSRRADTAATPL